MNIVNRFLNLLCLSGFEHARDHWRSQRETAVILFILTFWFLYQLLFVLNSFDFIEVQTWARDPLNALIIVLTSLYMIYHAELGVQVIIEDYVSENRGQLILLYSLRFFRICVVLTTLISMFFIVFES
ncbi:MAG: succinate dehydrogenase, hydrophobic membrane anchor protein [Rhodobiaceae bacterium]|jgi:succinate dehydrogenase / fumarate reductase, membrane anchor subunit|nr:succinate dehydrogenase, hydrophobic membrane anchor protein [Rhodobiaceae bacterium]|tara:strand:- start:14 stop:397 length:384 start_codon:yes stop_codon:yes gene_type:complete